MDIQNTVAVVTGAASGIGEAVVLELAARKCRAIAMVDQSERCCEVAEAVHKKFPAVATEAFVGDAVDAAFRERVFEQVRSKYGVAQICVPAAGITRDALAVKVDKATGKSQIYPLELFKLVIDVDLIAPIYWGMQLVAGIAEDRAARGKGRWEPEEDVQGTVIFIGSISSLGNKGQVSYASAKAGLEGAASTLAKEAMFHGVRFGVIHPGFTDTPMVRALGEEYIRSRILPQTQLRRLIRTEEIADAICFMISNSAVTGELWADAGWHPSA
ncbi:MAG TPA: SDR family oxidoreductase [Phycisphaerae bacterium]|nr:SDR family oxidoreductase [Phycisphaerae bacterium]HOJ73483.1 SDR family oxidoreductase [Phycisphaerae bacterium]HOM51092.1 SDR family oxidoreductase [Phycisphaerae bacterium]HON66756.1 SDR family oxidoreductase [Phycisphaerae bacterium]HOQ85277.1 SDR family oxidoreductase [Phycisphaerae bacterium]